MWKTKVINRQNILASFGKYYEKNSAKELKRDLIPTKEAEELAALILEEIGKQIYLAKAGVYIKDLGYFGVPMTMVKQKQKVFVRDTEGKARLKSFYNEHTRNYYFRVNFFPNVEKNSPFKFWVFDSLFSREVTRPLSKRLQKGDMPLLRYTEIYNANHAKKIK